ncbi:MULTISPECIES: DUF1289 domain-containing protein [unclassified Rhizobium]|uniref:DUF1289 domain-containing protein n=1 Tax=unclassified Rhizobium TaxID=2613769 RepID=UPI0006F256DD|nr:MULTISPECIES: DUF1289 domain-containing protein [unclassified Rhizobium]KQV41751.1 hypothetical protein ASC86_20265 [Rhizobium sp. Root1212]KRD30041.1 hypothetical protein ASE37_24045 [Rhizobium sp. Root268]
MKIESPCIDVCAFDPRKKWCVGCGRTLEEIKSWKKLTPFRRQALSNDLKHRMKWIEKNDAAKLIR